MKKRFLSALLGLSLVATLLVGCGGSGQTTSGTNAEPAASAQSEAATDAAQTDAAQTDTGLQGTLKVAAFNGGYGSEIWDAVTAKFMENNPGVTIELTCEKNLEEVISPLMKAGDYPDFVYLALGRELALPETLLKDNAIMDITDVLSMQVPGEGVTVGEKIIPGFTDTLVTNPNGDGKTYLAPMFYSPCGLWYDANLLETKGWEVPQTWEEMWALGDKAKAEGISLFTYPVAGYFDAFMFGLLTQAGGAEFYNRAMSYEDGIWETEEATRVFEIVGKLATYMEPTTVGNANSDNFKKNQQLVLDDKAIFMPNGNWIIGEMADAPRAEGFKWGFCPLPAIEKGGDRCAFTFFEQAWIPAGAQNPELAKAFMAYLYSDEAAEIFATAGASPAIMPIEGVSKYISDEETKMIYSIYDTGAIASMGGFQSTQAVEGVSMKETLFFTIDSIVTGDKTVEEWQKAVEEVSDQLRAAIVK
ncbi:MAG: carbohydrate ABC transporter substrate-binding protein [Lachnospiraceae bacterium]|nr:carbohydrate ABC transporter substrate-binding protein [Lachnospiraceae bacterium]MDD7051602.1 carbohydrate ABC transporter substrate-binding protein [Lachnospiraceae bacterium]MDY4096598.1 carbohydrate ABC transporter substrate-binding protein [Lachnospiraceae bacterium]